MNKLEVNETISNLGNFEVVNPINIENILNTDLLPLNIVTDVNLVEQSMQRLSFEQNLRNILNKQMTDQSISDSEFESLYIQLSDFLLMDSNNIRIVLYLPFNILPDFNLICESESLNAAKLKLQNILQNAFIKLLQESDVRANFVDGDVLEESLGIPERVRKAAHLIPEFTKRKIIDEQFLIDLFSAAEEPELIKSLLEGIIVGVFNNSVNQHCFDQIIEHCKTSKISYSILSTLLQSLKTENQINIRTPKNLTEIISDLEISLTELYATDNSLISNSRAKWLTKTSQNKLIDNAADQIANQILMNSYQNVAEIFSKEGFNNAFAVLAIESVFKAIQKTSYLNLDKAKQLFGEYKSFIESSAFNCSSEVKDAIITGLNYLVRLNVVNTDYLAMYNITLNDLSKVQPVAIEQLLTNDFKVLAKASKQIEANVELSKYIYPIFIAFGSRLKGYAGTNSDIDTVIIFKPETPFEKRAEILNLLKSSIPELKNIDKLLEIWTYSNNGTIGFRDVPATEGIIGPAQIHIIMQGMWIGANKDYNQVYSNLVSKYFNLSRLGDSSEGVRTHFLRQLELDALQCRLMHRGYRSFYPSDKNPNSVVSNLIDYTADFWDNSYRNIASLLFLKKVFLPDVSVDSNR